MHCCLCGSGILVRSKVVSGIASLGASTCGLAFPGLTFKSCYLTLTAGISRRRLPSAAAPRTLGLGCPKIRRAGSCFASYCSFAISYRYNCRSFMVLQHARNIARFRLGRLPRGVAKVKVRVRGMTTAYRVSALCGKRAVTRCRAAITRIAGTRRITSFDVNAFPISKPRGTDVALGLCTSSRSNSPVCRGALGGVSVLHGRLAHVDASFGRDVLNGSKFSVTVGPS